MSVAICWEVRNQVQCKTQQPQKRCRQEGQYTSIKLFRHRRTQFLHPLEINTYRTTKSNESGQINSSKTVEN